MPEIKKIFTHFGLNGKVIWDGKNWSKHLYQGFLGVALSNAARI